MSLPLLSLKPQHVPLRAKLIAARTQVDASHRYALGEEVRQSELEWAVWTVKLQQLAVWYNQQLASISRLHLPHTAGGTGHVIACHPRRNVLQLTEHGIGKPGLLPRAALSSAYQLLNEPDCCFLITEELTTACLSLPLWAATTAAQVATVTGATHAFGA